MLNWLDIVGVVWRGVVWCGVVWCGVVWCGVVWCGAVWSGVVWCGVGVGVVCLRARAITSSEHGSQGLAHSTLHLIANL